MYLCFVGGIIKDVEREMGKLISNRDHVREKVEAATETVNYAVFRWLNDVEELIQDEEKLAREEKKSEYRYKNFPWDASGPKKRYKNFFNKLQIIKSLNTKCEFELFFNSVPGSDLSSPYNFVCFESQKLASDQLFEALQDNNTCVIVLHGKQGTGKTKLLKAVADKAKYLKIFDKVKFLTVSQDSNVKSIQDEIGDWLGSRYKLIGENEEKRAQHISCILTLAGPLVIMDDAPEKFDLQSIGFPTSGRCKVILITRSQPESIFMDHRREIPLLPISKEEGWMFFKKHSGINEEESPSDLSNVALEVFSQCEGLPGRIIKVGSSLKNEPIEEWKAFLHSFRLSMVRYHIFLSFRGEDTRYSFTGFLYQDLCLRGYKTFMDDGIEGLRSGDLISPSLIEAIEGSRLSIIVLSENYAHSSWCLSELVKILDCMKTKNQLILPIFYKVESSDVRYQNNSYANAMAKHENRFGAESKEVQKWKSALFEVSNLPGKTYKTGPEYEFIQEIVEYVNSIKRTLFLQSMDMD